MKLMAGVLILGSLMGSTLSLGSGLSNWGFVTSLVVCEYDRTSPSLALQRLNFRINEALVTGEDVIETIEAEGGKKLKVKIRAPFQVSAPSVSPSIPGTMADQTRSHAFACVTLSKQ